MKGFVRFGSSDGLKVTLNTSHIVKIESKDSGDITEVTDILGTTYHIKRSFDDVCAYIEKANETVSTSLPQTEQHTEADNIDTENEVLLNTSIEELELSVRAYNALKNGLVKCREYKEPDSSRNYICIRDVVNSTPSELLEFRGLGELCLKEIKDALAEVGLSLKPDTALPA